MLTLLSPSRLTRAVLPSCEKPIPLGPALGLPKSIFPSGDSRLSFTPYTDTVPSPRLATSATLPSGETRTTVACAPAVSDCTTRGGLAVRSTTETWLLPVAMPPVAVGSALVEAVTIAQLSSGATHTDIGGPTTAPGTSMLVSTRGAALPNSITLSVSGLTGVAAICAPFTSAVWPSLDESAMSARAGNATPAASKQANVTRYIQPSLGLMLRYSIALARCRGQA